MNFKIDNSNKIYDKASKIIPAGSQTFSKGVTQFVKGVAPKYLKSGSGAWVVDADDNKFLDCIMGCHPLVLGYSDKDVNDAVIEQLHKGSTFSLMNELEVEVSQLIIDTIPSAEMVRFGKNGADATSVGIKIARAITGKDHVAYCGYHGWHDWFISDTDLNKGIPSFNKKLSHSFIYNDLSSLEKIFEEYKDQVAIVIMEPLTAFEPKCYKNFSCKDTLCKNICKNNFLTEVQKIAKHNNALLMFDEIITGYRFAVGGAQELVGVTPDLTSIAKAMSNGIPISAIVGKKEYMQCLDEVFFSFTYGGDCVGLSASKAAINKIKKNNVPKFLHDKGKVLKEKLNKYLNDLDLLDFFECIGYPQRSLIKIDGRNIYNNLELKTYIQQELLYNGILWAGYHAHSFKHDEYEIEFLLNGYYKVFEKFKNIHKNSLDIKSKINGEILKPVFRKVADFNSYINKSKT